MEFLPQFVTVATLKDTKIKYITNFLWTKGMLQDNYKNDRKLNLDAQLKNKRSNVQQI